jgi:hypothetical protein
MGRFSFNLAQILMNPTLRNVLLIGGALVLIIVALASINLESDKTLDQATFANRLDKGEVTEIVIRGNRMEVTLSDSSKVLCR